MRLIYIFALQLLLSCIAFANGSNNVDLTAVAICQEMDRGTWGKTNNSSRCLSAIAGLHFEEGALFECDRESMVTKYHEFRRENPRERPPYLWYGATLFAAQIDCMRGKATVGTPASER